MTDEEPAYEELSRQMRAAETKKRRTREKLIRATDTIMREEGWKSTVEAIVEEAGISTATYYTFYHSRNDLCMDAFIELVVEPLENLGIPERPFEASVDALVKQCEGRSALVRGALAWRLEDTVDSFKKHEDNFIKRIAMLLAEGWPPKTISPLRASEGYVTSYLTFARLAALYVLDAVATSRHVNMGDLMRVEDFMSPKD